MELVLLQTAKAYLGDRSWSVDIVLRMGAELAQAANKYPSLSGHDKSGLVCQTILKLLEDGEKAEKGQMGESTETTNTKVPWEECKMVVKTLLPATLDLIVSAARGKFDLQKAQQVVGGCLQVAPWRCLPFLVGLCQKQTPVEPSTLVLRTPPTPTPSQSNAVTELPKESTIQEATQVVHESPPAPSNDLPHDNDK
jgi:hypothetical protein